MPHIHMNIHISDTAMLCDAGVGIHAVQHMTLYLQINPLASEFKIPAEPVNAGDKMAPPR